MRRLLLGGACIAVLIGILVAGLWPFHSPRNDVTWRKDHNGLRFVDYGTVRSTAAFSRTGAGDQVSCSIELWLQPALTDTGGTILTFYSPHKPRQFSLYQSLSDLMLESGSSNSPAPARKQKIYINDVFHQGQSLLVTVTAGAQRISAYVNGTLAAPARRFQLSPAGCTGLLIIGDSTRQPDTWAGEVKGLAIYYNELTAPAVRRHYNTWISKGRPETDPNEHNVGLYLFDERAGDIVHNRTEPGIDLFIPETYAVLEKVFLEPFWDEFHMTWGYWENNLKNVVGFVPLGFCLAAYLSLVHQTKRAGRVTVILGGAVSLTIEVLQAFLPTRDSGTTDLVTNTLGTWLGVVLYKAASAQWELRRHI